MEEQNKTTESGQAAADLDKSLAHLETATRLTGLVVELQKAPPREWRSPAAIGCCPCCSCC